MQKATGRRQRERAILIGVELSGGDHISPDESLAELTRLADTAGLTVVDTLRQRLSRPNPATFIGSGKVQQLAELIEGRKIAVVVFDDDLSPGQVRNLEQAINARVIDRTVLILDIFAHRARTREARAQVELAQLNYLYPRLTRQWSHLERQRGGIGFRGPGESQLEVDRRLVGKRIKRLKETLKAIDKERAVQRRGRRDLFKVALVGYTNAGKSTLFNAMTKAVVSAEDRLFSTLDATTRVLTGNGHHRIVLTDTIGFIRKLPPQLLASFRATLAEIVDADLLLHVVDVSHDNHRDTAAIVDETLQQIKADHIPQLLVLNKVDLYIERFGSYGDLTGGDNRCHLTSATEREGLESLVRKIEQIAADGRSANEPDGGANAWSSRRPEIADTLES